MWLVVADLPVIAGYLAWEHSSTPNVGLSASAQAQLRKQISADGPLRAKSPDPAEPSSLRGKKPRTQMALRLLRPPKWEPDLMDYYLWRLPPLGSGGGDGRVFLLQGLGLVSGQLWRGFWSSVGHSPQPVPSSLKRPKKLRVPGRKLSPPDPLLMTLCLAELCEPGCWQNGTSNRHGLMVACY